FEWGVRADGVQTGSVELGAVAQRFISNLFSNPIVVGILAGWAWRLTGWPLPELADKLTAQLASVAGPVALFAIGLALIQFGFRSNFRQALATASVKLFFMPTIVLGVGLLVGLPPLALQVAVASAALPSGANPYLIATHFGTGQGLASNAMTIGTAISAASVLFWLLVVQTIAPIG
ncbi:MAG: AEC family transporter, partial [Pseudomonadota bacterium]